MRKTLTLIAAASLAAAAFGARAGEDSTERYGLQPPGPNWWESSCGLPCFALWRASGVREGEIPPQQLARVRSVDEMRTLIAEATAAERTTAFGATRGTGSYGAQGAR